MTMADPFFDLMGRAPTSRLFSQADDGELLKLYGFDGDNVVTPVALNGAGTEDTFGIVNARTFGPFIAVDLFFRLEIAGTPATTGARTLALDYTELHRILFEFDADADLPHFEILPGGTNLGGISFGRGQKFVTVVDGLPNISEGQACTVFQLVEGPPADGLVLGEWSSDAELNEGAVLSAYISYFVRLAD